MRTVLPEGVALIKIGEGLELRTYLDTGGVPTIGYGHTGKDVKLGQVITRMQAEDLFALDLQNACADVSRHVPTVTDTQFSALVSFVYNLGVKQFLSSTLLKKHIAGDYAGAAEQFGRWVHDNGKVLPGLVKRRAAEAALYSRPGKPI